LLIVVSQSGETADTIAAIKECKSRGAKVLAICNVVASTIAMLADNVIYTWAGPEIAVATTKGYTTQVAVLNMFAVYAADKLKLISADRYNKLVSAIRALPREHRGPRPQQKYTELAKLYHNNSSLFFIGRNIDYAVCLEPL
jgi:glucosamine--fructose-6-phosphate aminotransferase (isomerizing)